MSAQSKATKDLLGKLEHGETSKEAELHGKLTSAMRSRVSDRLASERPEFMRRRTRMGKLRALHDNELAHTISIANETESELSKAIDARSLVTMYDLEATVHTRDPVHRKVDGKEVVEYVDNSDRYRRKAAFAASAAQSHTQNANTAMSKLPSLVRALDKHPTLVEEKLTALGGTHGGVSTGSGFLQEMFMPEALNLVGSFGSSSGLSDARTGVQRELQALHSIDGELKRRHDVEHGWVEKQLDVDLDRQMELAAK